MSRLLLHGAGRLRNSGLSDGGRLLRCGGLADRAHGLASGRSATRPRSHGRSLLHLGCALGGVRPLAILAMAVAERAELLRLLDQQESAAARGAGLCNGLVERDEPARRIIAAPVERLAAARRLDDDLAV